LSLPRSGFAGVQTSVAVVIEASMMRFEMERLRGSFFRVLMSLGGGFDIFMEERLLEGGVAEFDRG